jgi:hypothetical protein
MRNFFKFQLKQFSIVKQASALSKNKADSMINNFKNIENLNIIPTLPSLNQEEKLNKSMLAFYTFLHAPLYIISIPLALDSSNFVNLVDWARLSLRSIPCISFVLSGINTSTLLLNLESDIKNKVKNNIEINDEDARYEESKVYNSIYLSLFPSFVNFFSSLILLNSSILTNQIIFGCFSGFVFSNLIQLYVVSRKINSGTSSSYFKINLLFFLLNLLSYLFILKFILKNKSNGLKRVDDEYRLENLNSKDELIINDTKYLEEELENIYSSENTPPEVMRKIEEIYDKV